MKIRIKGNTIRYRLTKTEVAALADKGVLEEKTEFINGTLQYAITQTEGAELSADFNQNTITLYVPKAALQQWADTEQVGIDGNMWLPNGSELHLLLEKDFKCTDAGKEACRSSIYINFFFRVIQLAAEV